MRRLSSWLSRHYSLNKEMARIFTDVRDALRAVFRQPRYLAFAGAFGGAALALSVWLNNVPLLRLALWSPDFTVPDKVLLLGRLLGGLVTGFSEPTIFLLLVVSVLFGINGALLVYSFSHHRGGGGIHGGGSSLAALVSGVFGAGCASCGTYLLGAMLASFGAGGLLSFLPLGGREFLLVSIVLLVVSIAWGSRSLVSAGACAVTVEN